MCGVQNDSTPRYAVRRDHVWPAESCVHDFSPLCSEWPPPAAGARASTTGARPARGLTGGGRPLGAARTRSMGQGRMA